MSTIELRVPDIGDFKDVEVIELLVKPGQQVEAEQSLVTVESDKASMEIPASHAGKIVELKVALGSKVSQGALLALVEPARTAAPAAAAAQPPAAATATHAVKAEAQVPVPVASSPMPALSGAATPSAARYGGKVDAECEVLVLGAGPGGYSAAFRSADLGRKVTLVERFATLGGVCLNVGCIPSKALLHVAAVVDEAAHFERYGIEFGAPKIDLDKLRAHKAAVVGKLTGGLAQMAKLRKVDVVQGKGSFVSANHLQVVDAQGKVKTIAFEQAIIAAGSQPARLPFLPDDPRIVDSTGALELRGIPKRMLVIGGGIIGLEMASVYSTLGARIDVVEMLDGLMPGADRDLVQVWQKHNQARFDRVMLRTKTIAARAAKDGIRVRFDGEQAPAEELAYDLVLVAVGRTPNGKLIGAERAGVAVTDRGYINVDRQLRTNVGHIFAIGDIIGQPMLAHKAVHEGHVAAEAAAGQKSYFDARVIPSVAYTDPEIAWVGLTEDDAARNGIKLGRAVFPWSASGRAIANGRDEGFTKLLVDEATHRVVGGAIVGTHAGDMIGELALAIEMGCDVADIGRTIHPHPTLGESIGMVAELFEGVCTDLPPPRKKAGAKTA